MHIIYRKNNKKREQTRVISDLSEALKAESLTYSDDVELIAGEADDSRMKFYSHHTPHSKRSSYRNPVRTKSCLKITKCIFLKLEKKDDRSGLLYPHHLKFKLSFED